MDLDIGGDDLVDGTEELFDDISYDHHSKGLGQSDKLRAFRI